MELILELIGSFLFEVLTELALAFGWESLRDATGPRRRANPVLAALGLVLLGSMAGCGTVAVLPRRILPEGPVPGLALLLSPIGTGLVMRAYGRRVEARGREPSPLATFWGGAAFAFSASCRADNGRRTGSGALRSGASGWSCSAVAPRYGSRVSRT